MSERLADAEFLHLLEWLQQRTGLTFRSDQHANTRAVVDRVIKTLQVSHLGEVPSALLKRPEMLAALVNALTVGETYFFRESRHFDLLREQVIPEVQQRRGPDHRLRIWSAACASGEEAYSIAMLAERLKLSPRPYLLATDLSEAALQRAGRATYRSWSLRGEEAAAARDFLHQDGTEYRLDDRIKSLVTLRQHNLAADDYPSIGKGISDFDVIFCRNVLIYFSKETIRAIAQRMMQTLAAGGWLITASADPSLRGFADFEITTTRYGLVYRKRLTRPIKRATMNSGAAASFDRSGSESGPQPLNKGSCDCSDRFPQVKMVDDHASVPAPISKEVTVAATKNQAIPAVDLASNLAAAVAALEAGELQRAAELTKRFEDDATACVVHARALAALDSVAAIEFCLNACRRHPLKAELHYLAAVQLADANRSLEALQSLQKVLFLDRSAVLAHFLFGSLQRQLGQWKSARRHFRNVCELCAIGKPSEVPPWSRGETLADLAIDAQNQLDRLN